jgi:hypothetical protein
MRIKKLLHFRGAAVFLYPPVLAGGILFYNRYSWYYEPTMKSYGITGNKITGRYKSHPRQRAGLWVCPLLHPKPASPG